MNWVNVGYYSGHTDKLNSFQLLLVNREDSSAPGDFDIVFNYNQVQWETGDASGGSGGLGGTSASAGFSNGSGQGGTSYQLAGSLTNGAFLDASPTGLAATNTDSTVPGRHVFRVRGGNAPLTRYVALGDSFQSGEGAYDYISPTDTAENKCHRSAHAYPKRLVDDGTIPLNLDFGACSGTLTSDMSVANSTAQPPYTDGISQLDRLGSSTKLVTLGIGGNDLGFGPILQDCITVSAGDFFNPFAESSCEADFGDRLQDSFTTLASGNKIGDTYKEVRRRAPFARIAILIADRVRASLQSADPGAYYNTLPGQTVTSTFEAAGGPVSLSTQWPGSDVVMSLKSPSGRVIDRSVSSPDVQHEVGPTFESYHLASTEPGLWTVSLYGARVAPHEPTRLSVWHAPKLNLNPVAAFSFSLDAAL